MLVKAFFTGHRTVHEDLGGLNYTVFLVDVFVDGVKHSIERRYSEFEDLHKTLKKQISVPVFPPKKVLNKSSKVIEERRRLLEAYLQHVLQQRYFAPEVLQFLEIAESQEYESDNSPCPAITHDIGQPVSKDSLTMCPFSKSSSPVDDPVSRDNSPDIILQGIYRSLYAGV